MKEEHTEGELDLNELSTRIIKMTGLLEYGLEHDEEELISVLKDSLEALDILYMLYADASEELEERDITNAMHLKSVTDVITH